MNRIIGKRMRAALEKIKANPGIEEALLKREFGFPIVTNLLKYNLVTTEDSELGRKVTAIKTKLVEHDEPIKGFVVVTSADEPDMKKLIAHNQLAVLCPVCKSPAGRSCKSTKDGREVRWPHRQRTEQALYVQAVLMSISDQAK
jgi:hypothetical protein